MSESKNLRADQSRSAADTSVSLFAIPWQRILGEAKLYWPNKTAEHVAKFANVSPRTAYRWLAGKAAPPAPALLKVVSAMRDAHRERGRIFEQFELPLS